MFKDKNGQRKPTVTKDGIYGFNSEYRWLSNFYPCFIYVGDITYPSSEHAYVAYKTTDRKQKEAIAKIASSAEVKKFGGANGSIIVRPDWEQFRLVAMMDVLMAKFQAPELLEKLIATGTKYLEESNDWNDKFWGVHWNLKTSEKEGLNMLGKCLMVVRDRFT